MYRAAEPRPSGQDHSLLTLELAGRCTRILEAVAQAAATAGERRAVKLSVSGTLHHLIAPARTHWRGGAIGLLSGRGI
jgi:hypothetical protein